jgi:hypothetical protein
MVFRFPSWETEAKGVRMVEEVRHPSGARLRRDTGAVFFFFFLLLFIGVSYCTYIKYNHGGRGFKVQRYKVVSSVL